MDITLLFRNNLCPVRSMSIAMFGDHHDISAQTPEIYTGSWLWWYGQPSRHNLAVVFPFQGSDSAHHLEEYLNVPSLTVNSNNFFVRQCYVSGHYSKPLSLLVAVTDEHDFYLLPILGFNHSAAQTKRSVVCVRTSVLLCEYVITPFKHSFYKRLKVHIFIYIDIIYPYI